MIPYCRKGSPRPPIMWCRYQAAALLLLLFFATICTSDTYYDDCSTPTSYPSSCGGIIYNISFPFSTPDRPNYCSHPEYNLVCDPDSNMLMANINGHGLQVKSIDYDNQVLVVAEPLFAQHLCPYTFSGLVLDLLLFNYTGDINVTLYLNCTVPDPHSLEKLHPIACLNGRLPSYYGLGERLPLECESTAIIPVSQAFEPFLNDTDNFWKAIAEGFNLTWMVGKDWCRDCNKNKEKSNKTWKVVGGCVGGVGVISLAFALCFWYKTNKRKQRSVSANLLIRSMSSELSSTMDPELGSVNYRTHIFSYEELHLATNGFNEELGDGGFGTVYKGQLRDGRIVAVKRLYENNCKRVEQFMNEVDILSRLRHKYLVTLYGCTTRHSRELLLVYEFISNGTVADHLHGPRASDGGLTWPVRLNIAIETADALAYLHAVEPQIIHRDVKTNNILLDNNFHVKVADFGLSRLFPMDASHVSTLPQGTPGYVDPEYHQCYQLTDKSDVYSFGVVLVELISSKPAVDISRHRHEINLASMAINKIQNRELEKLFDPHLGYQTEGGIEKMLTMVAELAFRCLQGESEMRPSIKEVLAELMVIQNVIAGAEKTVEANTQVKEESCLLKNGTPFSPDTVTARWDSILSTPNASG